VSDLVQTTHADTVSLVAHAELLDAALHFQTCLTCAEREDYCARGVKYAAVMDVAQRRIVEYMRRHARRET
jgi:hypothetical protein